MNNTKGHLEKSNLLNMVAVFTIFAIVGTAFYSFFSTPEELADTKKKQDYSGVETDTLERLKTVGNSGSNWGMNPFGTGKPLEEAKHEFKMPNTEWKTRTISGVTYVFGEGNPKEVTPKSEDYNSFQDFFHDNSVKKVTESQLIEFLTNPSLSAIINICGKYLIPDIYNTRSQIIVDFPYSIYNTSFNLDDILYVDIESRQKKLDINRMEALGLAIQQFKESEECLQHIDGNALQVLLHQYLSIVSSYQNDGSYPVSSN